MHVLSGQWPFPGEAVRVNPRNPNDPNDLVGVTEFDRRDEYINKIDNQHPLMNLIQLCLSNSPSHRPTSCEVQQQVNALSGEHPASFANRVEMLERIKALGEEKEAVRMENNNAMAEKDEQIAELRREKDERIAELRKEKDTAIEEKEQVSAELEASRSTVDRLQQYHSIELEEVQLEVSDLKEEIEDLQTIVNAKEREVGILQINHQEEIEAYKRSSTLQLAALKNEHTTVKQAMKKHHQAQLELKISELSSKEALVSSKSRTIQSLQEKLGRALEASSLSIDSLNVFSPGVKLNFTECAKLQLGGEVMISQLAAIVVGKEVYVAFVSVNIKYNIAEDSWSTLPEAPVVYSRIGSLSQKIILVGGKLRSNGRETGDIYEWDEATQQWVRSTSIPPMPTRRHSATAVSWTSPSALIVCGGSDEKDKPMTVVEVYHSETSQWHTVSPLPFPRDCMSHTVIHSVLYLVGGYEGKTKESHKKTVMSTSIPQLLESCLQPSRTPRVQWQSGSIPDVPYYRPAAASLGGCLLVVGGYSIPKFDHYSSVHAYCPSSSSWVRVGELPQPLGRGTTVSLPTGELLIVRCWWSRSEVISAYKCCLSVEK